MEYKDALSFMSEADKENNKNEEANKERDAIAALRSLKNVPPFQFGPAPTPSRPPSILNLPPANPHAEQWKLSTSDEEDDDEQTDVIHWETELELLMDHSMEMMHIISFLHKKVKDMKKK